jgi:flagellar basal body-associated protein FliL
LFPIKYQVLAKTLQLQNHKIPDAKNNIASKQAIPVSKTVSTRRRDFRMNKTKLILISCVAIMIIAPVFSSAQDQVGQDKSAQNIEQPPDLEKQIQQLQEYQQQLERYNNTYSKKEKGSEVYFFMFVLFPLALGIIAIIAIFFVVHAKKEKRRHELISRFIEKGQEVPRELLLGSLSEAAIPPEQWPSFIRLRDLRRGTWLLCLGLGIGLILYLLFDFEVAALCLIFLFLSGACFVNAIFFSGNSDNSQ